jgi:hypothetical protein
MASATAIDMAILRLLRPDCTAIAPAEKSRAGRLSEIRKSPSCFVNAYTTQANKTSIHRPIARST